MPSPDLTHQLLTISIDIGKPPIGEASPSPDLYTKAEANYRKVIPNDGRKSYPRCGTCTNFSSPEPTAPGSCALVSGSIDPYYTCDHYSPLPKNGSAISRRRSNRYGTSSRLDNDGEPGE